MDPITYWDSQVGHWLGKARTEVAAGRTESAQAARLTAGTAALRWLMLRVDEEGPHLMPPDIQEQLDFEQVARDKDKILARVHHQVCAELLALKVSRPDV
ncbi:hypothetical protein H7H82_03080 [Mycobacterium heidelbergense]|uniref:Uncharacterized protein n=1 Tax=Mycobacterium heidelbergense TaxID=53376 RepID=A0A1X0DNE9_MYCHE|nr:hypothetical protein [Mycobacterium heidelbergense]MCV7049597.1 hypothetical protein [Mycobacterium heidelbergense]ORA73916.1 hypothetical protein BST25_10970 [Mycobacterium heidelbergense]BBZ52731.1 hypothetical protein MHEI_44480 [Mycobacterium heidelbergense]